MAPVNSSKRDIRPRSRLVSPGPTPPLRLLPCPPGSRRGPSAGLFDSSHSEAVELFHSHFSIDRARADLDQLRRIVRHYARIPYENISKIIKVAGDDDPEAKLRLPLEVMKDHAAHRLGGTCFSLTYFLEQILLASGYCCHKAMAHMQAGENIHCVMVVEVSRDRYLVDPGYLLWEPLLLSAENPQTCQTPRGLVELVYEAAGDVFHLFTLDARGRKWRYLFADRPVSDQRFREHWIASFSRPTMHHILLNQLTEKGQLYIRGNHLRLTSLFKETKGSIRQDYHHQIQRCFGIDPGLVEEALSILRQQRLEWTQKKDAGLG
jgi:arylamine N-acetyltransferase